MKRTITRNRAKLAVSENDYMCNALVHYDHLLHLDAQLQDELQDWDRASIDDFNTWTQKHQA